MKFERLFLPAPAGFKVSKSAWDLGSLSSSIGASREARLSCNSRRSARQAPAASSAEHHGLLSYNERYKHFERLIVLGFHLAWRWAHDAGGGSGGRPPLSESTETVIRSAGWRFAD